MVNASDPQIKKYMTAMTRFSGKDKQLHKQFVDFYHKVLAWGETRQSGFSNELQKGIIERFIGQFNQTLTLKNQWEAKRFKSLRSNKSYMQNLRDLLALQHNIVTKINLERSHFKEIIIAYHELMQQEKKLRKHLKGQQFEDGLRALTEMGPLLRRIPIDLKKVKRFALELVHTTGEEVAEGRDNTITELQNWANDAKALYTQLDGISTRCYSSLYYQGNDYIRRMAATKLDIRRAGSMRGAAACIALGLAVAWIQWFGVPQIQFGSSATAGQDKKAPVEVREIATNVQVAPDGQLKMRGQPAGIEATARIEAVAKVVEGGAARVGQQLDGKKLRERLAKNPMDLAQTKIIEEAATAYYGASEELKPLFKHGRIIPNAAMSPELKRNRLRWAQQIERLLANRDLLGTVRFATIPALRTTAATLKGLPGMMQGNLGNR